MDSNYNLDQRRKKPKQKDFDVNTITKERLNEKNNFLSKLALFTRRSEVHFSFILITSAFVIIIFLMLLNIEYLEKSAIVLVLLFFCIYVLPNTVGRQVWNMEKSKTMRELSPLSPKTFLYTFGAYIRWIYPLATLILFFFVVIGFLKGY